MRSDANGNLVYSQEKFQVLQIGANMVDQSDKDSFPTEVVLDNEHFYGSKTSSYINALADTALRPLLEPALHRMTIRLMFIGWLTISLWNPPSECDCHPPLDRSLPGCSTNQGSEYPQIHNTASQGKGYPPFAEGKDFSLTPA